MRALRTPLLLVAYRLLGNRRWTLLLSAVLLAVSAAITATAQVQLGAGEGVAQLEAKQQRREGQIFYADGDVEIRYQQLRIRADHVEYDTSSFQVIARGHVQFDYDSLQLQAERAEVNIRTGRGRFERVRGTARIERQPNPSILVTPNPLSFEAAVVERLDERTYEIHGGWFTVCEPQRPTWSFSASRATLRVGRHVAFVNANFRLFRIPLIYLPYATVPAGRKVRQSGFLLPEVGRSAAKGFIFRDAYYWAPASWADATIGAQWFSSRGWSQRGNLRLLPAEDIRLSVNYFGVLDRKRQGGRTFDVQFDAVWPGGWRAVADLSHLTSLTFRLAFSPTFGEAVNSEVRSTAFVTNNFDGFSLNFAAANYKNFLSAQPETAVVLRRAPEVRFHAVDQAPWRGWPFYFGVDVFADAAYRSDTQITTPAMVQRSGFAPRMTIPLHLGPWLDITPTFTFRTMRYGAGRDNGIISRNSVVRTTGELQVDLRPASLRRIWERPNSKWKHTVEPAILYRYVTGVNEFGRFLRFDERDTLTDTNEVEYSITQRLFHRSGSAASGELVSWRVAQKHYFDPTFEGAIVVGRRNVFQALSSLTPFAFADGSRRFSPIVSVVKISPGSRHDAELRTDYDPVRRRITAHELLMRIRPYGVLEMSLAHYAVRGTSTLQPRSNQIRAILSYGDLTRRGWNGALGFSYDVRQKFLQNQIAQVGYNGSCCGIAFEYRRLSLGQVRQENEYRTTLVIANLGMFGNLRPREIIF